jgi:hypothetical protein
MSALPQAIATNPHTNLQNVCIQIENKIGVSQKKKFLNHWPFPSNRILLRVTQVLNPSAHTRMGVAKVRKVDSTNG